jgi:protocatechuate 3,4-dioxygenase beta subunit
MQKIVRLLFLILCLTNNTTNAFLPEIIEANAKLITPSISSDEYDLNQKFNSSNNLRRMTGSYFLAKGEPLIVEGFVVDLTDKPIEGAVVQIWHANYLGYYQDNAKAKNIDLDFAGNGTSITDKRGKYHFLTIMPYFYDNRAPHVHFMVKKTGFDTLTTEMFFPEHPRNKKDEKYKSISPEKRYLITDDIGSIFENSVASGKVAKFNIRLNGLEKTGVY